MKRVGEATKTHLYYRCADRLYNFPLPRTCFEKGINAQMLDDLVYENVVKLFENKPLLKEQAERWLKFQKNSTGSAEQQFTNLKKTLGKIDEEEQRYLKAFGSGLVSYDAYQKQMKDLNSRKQRLQNSVTDLRSTITEENDRPQKSIESIMDKAIQTIKNFRFEDKQNLIRRIIKQIIANQSEASIHGLLPLDFGTKGAQNVAFKLKDSNSEDAITSNITTGDKNVVLQSKDWNRRTAKCRQINIIQRFS
jgi:hypothetical protein